MSNKVALVTGITGQDGAYLLKLLMSKGYVVHGLRRRVSVPTTQRIDEYIFAPQEHHNEFHLHYGDLTDGLSLTRIIQRIQPDEIYNLGAQSHVHVSFDSPEYTADVNGLGTLRILEAIRNLDLTHKTRFYQASTSELYGKIQSPQQSESTPFYPRSPYAVAKLFAYWTVINYREAYGLYGCNGILFNHESAMRGTSFVTRKITYTLSRIAYGLIDKLYLGNMNALRDWGHARDYVEMQWLMLQQEQPEDYVIASGERRSVREFVEVAAREIGFSIEWRGLGVDEVGLVSEVDPEKIGATFGKGRFKLKPGDEIVNIDPYYFRPTEVDVLWGDASKAREKLNWSPKTSFLELVSEMVAEDLEQARKQVVVNQYE